jgi:hypothetical protein
MHSEHEHDHGDGDDLDGAPIYLVRWPNLSACLVRAHDERQLKHMLDEIADPGVCEWQVYRGPLWVEFDLPVGVSHRAPDSNSPASRADLQLDNVEALLQESYELTPSIPGGDTGSEMHDAVLASAFPATYDALRTWRSERDGLEGNPERAIEDVLADMRRAMLDDLKVYLEAGWRTKNVRRRARQGDLGAIIMDQMGLTDDLYLPPTDD